MARIRVLVVDDHTIVRDGVCALLRLSGDMEVVGEASQGREALEKVRALSPEVVLMDIAMPNMDGLEATKRIRKEFPKTRVLVLTQYEDKEYILPILEAGASGFINKTAAAADLLSAVRSIASGHSFLSPQAAQALVEDFQRGTALRKQQDFYRELTAREREILKLLAEGQSVREIASNLFLSTKTVEGHKTRLMMKLDLHSRVDLVKYALRKGIITI